MTQKGAGQTWIGCLLLRVGTRQESEDAYKTFLRCTLAAGLAAAVEGSRAPRANVKGQLVVHTRCRGGSRQSHGQPGNRNLLIQYAARVERPATHRALGDLRQSCVLVPEAPCALSPRVLVPKSNANMRHEI